MTTGEVIGSVLTAIIFGNLITAKLVGLSYLSWSDTLIVLICYLAIARLSNIVLEAMNKGDKED